MNKLYIEGHKVVQLGTDDPNEINYLCDDVWFEHEILLLVHDYYSGDYQGWGEAVALCKNGIILLTRLECGSCYGPFEDNSPKVMSLNDYLEESKSVLCDHNDKIKDEIVKFLFDNVS